MSSRKVIIALDDMEERQALDFLKEAHPHFPNVKIGLELFHKLGPDFVRRVHGDFGVGVFLDLKLHDIPNTVRKAIRALKGLPASFLTVHLSGGREMLTAAVEETFIALPGCTLLGVSVLTSLNDQDMMDIWGSKTGAFHRLFDLGLSCKVPGMVLSAQELPLLQEREHHASREVVKVCPGIRFKHEIASGAIQDQKRVLTPQEAFALGADYLVMGRSFTQLSAEKLLAAVQSLKN